MERIQVVGSKDEEILSLSLRQILEFVNQGYILKWKILWFEGIGSGSEDILAFEKKINQSSNGVCYNYEDLLKLEDKIFQLIDIVVIGSKDENKLIRYQKDVEMYNNCEYIIELIDSSYWEVSSNNRGFIKKIKLNLEGIKDII